MRLPRVHGLVHAWDRVLWRSRRAHLDAASQDAALSGARRDSRHWRQTDRRLPADFAWGMEPDWSHSAENIRRRARRTDSAGDRRSSSVPANLDGRIRPVARVTLRIVGAGLQTTVQDLGRPGQQRLGIPGGGAMDVTALRVGNLLV